MTKGSPLQQRLFSALSKKEIHSALVEWMIRSLKFEERNGFQAYNHDMKMANFDVIKGIKYHGINQNMWPWSKLAADKTPQSEISSAEAKDGETGRKKPENGTSKKKKSRPHQNARVG